ncbi:MAG: cyclase family protein [Candidatus Melainabacteria bacterium]|nr:cyclase family protein [Candidatus Melainabacteria bacterium]
MQGDGIRIFDLTRSTTGGFDEVAGGPPYRGTVTIRYSEADLQDLIASYPEERRRDVEADILGELRYHPLKPYIGPATIIEVSASTDGSIGVAELSEKLDRLKAKVAHGANPEHIQLPSRMLLKTGFDPAGSVFPHLTPQSIDLLYRDGVTLVGLDTPGPDHPRDAGAGNRHHFRLRGMIWLVGLELSAFTGVQGGMLLAAPVDRGRTGPAPVRAVLVKGRSQGKTR